MIDGVLDDAVWQQAEVISDFTQVEPVEGAPPSYRTEVRFLTDNESLFISFRAFDPEPDRIVANLMGRGEFFFYDDNFTLVFDTFHDHRNGFFIQVNPLGGRRDGTFERENFEENWDGIWFANAQIDELGWTAEIQIPFRTFSIKPGADAWGFNMVRRVRRLNEEMRWADPNIDRLLINMGDAGILTGLSGASQGFGLDVVPGLTLQASRDEVDNDSRVDAEPTFDAFYRVLPSLTASVTANTDFSQTEVDNQEVNFSRFALFFPEKRQFFLEDGGVFAFGGLYQENGMPFFSRRIGLDSAGQFVRLPVGAKLAGRVGPVSIGMLNIQQDRHDDVETTNLSVVRMSTNVLEESTAGFIVTQGDPLSNDRNALGGLDFNYRSSTLIPGRFVTANFWAQQTFSGRNDYGQMAGSWGAQIVYPNDHIRWDLSYKEVQNGFDPALGFVNRDNIRAYDFDWRYRYRPQKGVLRTVDSQVQFDMTTDRERNNVESWSLRYLPLTLTNQVDDSIQLQFYHIFDRVPDGRPFFVVPHVGIRNGHYNSYGTILTASSSRNRKIRGNFGFGYGGLYDGIGLRISGLLEWRPSAHFLLSLQYDEREFRGMRAFHGGDTTGTGPSRRVDFRVRISRVRVRINFTPNISWSTFAQYDNVSNTVTAQSIFRWIIQEGNDLYLVLGQDLDATPDDFRVGTTAASARLSWTFRF